LIRKGRGERKKESLLLRRGQTRLLNLCFRGVEKKGRKLVTNPGPGWGRERKGRKVYPYGFQTMGGENNGIRMAKERESKRLRSQKAPFLVRRGEGEKKARSQSPE